MSSTYKRVYQGEGEGGIVRPRWQDLRPLDSYCYTLAVHIHYSHSRWNTSIQPGCSSSLH
ncbi:unnamed protein product [Meloidogyne enterolobii]|uniref:Uncharacterized protein n=1 Tax=Meloidogyne enterolobii TaxID=390850 RepID=A0ACB1A947_MELEN